MSEGRPKDAAYAASTGILSFGQYFSSYSGLTDNQITPLRVNSDGELIVSGSSNSSTIIRAEHSSTLPSLNDGDLTRLQVDSKGRLLMNLDTEIAGEDLSNDVLMSRLKLDDGSGSFDFVQRIDESISITDGSHAQASTTGHTTQTSWTTVATLERTDNDNWKEIRPYVVDTSGGGNTTDARLLIAIDPSAVGGDEPTGTVGNGFIIVDQALSANSNAIASAGDWPEITTGYEVDSHLVVLQVQQGSGQETVDAYLRGDRDK